MKEMARTLITVKTDDLDGTPAVTTRIFTIDGTTFSLDLNQVNADTFTEILAPWLEAATVIAVRKPPRNTEARRESSTIREWAAANGHPVKDRGRLPAEVKAAYHSAQRILQAVA